MNEEDSRKLVAAIKKIVQAAIVDEEFKHSDYAGAESMRAEQEVLFDLITCCGEQLEDVTTQDGGGTWGEINLKCRECGKELTI